MNTARIWLIGGTQESAELARAIAAQNWPCVISVTTASARSLYPVTPHLTIWVGRVTPSELLNFLQAHSIGAILDASHPFAVAISQQAMAIAAEMNIPYLRFERPELGADQEPAAGQQPAASSQQPVVHDPSLPVPLTFPSFESLLSTDLLKGQRVLLTIGYRALAQFTPWQERAVLFTRILPSVTALQAAIAAGFTSERIIALRPPITAKMERALWQQWQISMVIAKASGEAGGEAEKRQVSAELNVPLVIIERPAIVYSQQTSDISIALQFCQQALLTQ